MRRKPIYCIIAIFILFSHPAIAANLRGNSVTIFRSYEVENVEDRDEAFLPLTQYLQFNITNIGGREISFYSDTRAVMDLGGEREFLDVLTATLDWKNFVKQVDLHLGRQYILWGQGFFSIDGLQVNVNDIGPFSFDMFGGLPVRKLREREREKGDGAWGGRISLTGFPDTTLGISYERQEFQSDLSEEKVGIDFGQWLLDRFNFYGNTTYNIGLDQFEESLIGGKIVITKSLDFSGEYFRFIPTFELEEIFNIFDIEPYYEISGQVNYKVFNWLEIFARYGKQFYADTPAADDDNDRIVLGGDIFFPNDGNLSFAFSIGEGFGGVRRGVELSGYRYFFNNSLRLGGGVNLFNYNFSRFAQGSRKFGEDEEDFSMGLTLNCEYIFPNLWELGIELENYNDKFFNNQFRTFVTLNIPFNFGF